MPYLDFFELEVLIKYCHISNYYYQMCLNEKICEETKKSNFGTKMPYLNILNLDLNSKGIFVSFEISTFEYV